MTDQLSTDQLSVVARAICSGSYADADKCGGPGCDCGEWGLHVFEAKAALSALEAQGLVIVLVETLTAVVDDDPCEFDHHGYCQTHGWMYAEPCPTAKLQAMLAALEVKDD